MCGAGAFAVQNRLYLASVAVTAGARINADLTITRDVLLSHRAVSISTNGVVAISVVAVVVAVVSIAVVAIGYPVIYQGTVLILTELADQLGLQS